MSDKSLITHLKEKSLTILTGLFLLLLIPVKTTVVEPVLGLISDKMTKLQLIQTTSAIVLLLIVSAYFHLYVWLNNREKLKFKFGVYWSKEKYGICLLCKIPFSIYHDKYDVSDKERISNSVWKHQVDYKQFEFKSCHDAFVLYDDNGNYIERSKAIKML
jgi:hypothetical protein